jgi:dolichol-phosphate mannosyltransferase
MPGHSTRQVNDVQANGQCFLCKREALGRIGGFEVAKGSLCEDVTIARALAKADFLVGFYEAPALASVRMYSGFRETWVNWPRSLTLRDRFSDTMSLLGLLEVLLVQALPLPLVLALLPHLKVARRLVVLNQALVALRIGMLFGVRRAYREPHWTYWLSPLCDLPVALRLIESASRRRHTWRGRVVRRGV